MVATVAWRRFCWLVRLDTKTRVALLPAMASLVEAAVVGEVVHPVHVTVRHTSRVDNLLQVHHLVSWLGPLVGLAEALLKSREVS